MCPLHCMASPLRCVPQWPGTMHGRRTGPNIERGRCACLAKALALHCKKSTRDSDFVSEMAELTLHITTTTTTSRYRVYVFPLFISVLPDMQESGKLLWLTIAAWFFFLPNLLLVEIYLRYERRGNAGKLRVPRSELPMHA